MTIDIRSVRSEERQSVAAAAALERDLRAQHYPAQVGNREIAAEEAEADYHAWSAIAAWLEAGSVAWAAWGLSWPQLAHAASQALIRREQACQAKPASAALARRRDDVAAILSLLQRQRADMDDLNAKLRARLGRKAA